MKIDFVKFSNLVITPTKGGKIQLCLTSKQLRTFQFHQIPLNLLRGILALRFLEEILEKCIPGLVFQLDALKLADALLMPFIEGQL